MAKSVARRCYDMTGLFEAELLVELMLRYFKHPLADDVAYRGSLLESASDALLASSQGERLFDEITPSNVSLVAAVWYSEWAALQTGNGKDDHRDEREAWLTLIRRTLPACFCDPDSLT